ncbi:MAG: aspartate--ammonia ligase [Clostridia bacterium]|nr:aspartate--ammonia ligase [Clostridia bacterium]MBQ2940973.1 aspartate--ammonia ligase [Clostridia bacterium]
MSRFIIPKDYQPKLGLYETQKAIEVIKQNFVENLTGALNLRRVTAPLFVESRTGLNDNLSGVERAVAFDIPDADTDAQVVHSLAKWKRMALGKYEFPIGEGLYTDMNAIRRDEELSNLHSVYVDQWDWCKVISREDRNRAYLEETVRGIVNAVCDTLDALKAQFPQVKTQLSREVHFVTTQELEDRYPGMTAKERETACTKEHKTVFIMQIGDVLNSGEKHDMRAPDYDDWKLNGDIMFWDDVLELAIEISSMGIRVDEKSLSEQLTKAGCDDRRELPFHKALLAGKLPLTMGGGIGQSRLCMLLLGKAHIGEVQVSVWDEKTIENCKNHQIQLL